MWQARRVSLWAITGGSGFVGVHLARRLLAEGARVRTLDLEPLDEPGVEAIVGDIRDPRAVEALCRHADVLVHAAAALPIRRSASEIRSVTIDGTAAVLAAAAEAGARRAVFVSSGVVYGIPRRAPVPEDEAVAPFEAYGRAKVAAEQLCADFTARGLHTVVLRPSAIVGPERLGAFGILFGWIREGHRIYTLGKGTNRYQLLDVSDLVQAIVLAGERPVPRLMLNVGAAEVGTVRDVLEGVIAHAGSASRVTALPAAPARAALAVLAAARISPLTAWHYRTADRDVVLDVSRAQQDLGWSPRYSSEDALIRSYDSFVAEAGRWGADGSTHRAPWGERALGLLRRVS